MTVQAVEIAINNMRKSTDSLQARLQEYLLIALKRVKEEPDS